ncbi:MAG: Ferric siderophore transport system, periplasmic binding protein TonB [Labilithrix sp.]|nr:Ferric siderophore transport system, periplasmic binding protein TonB [Labilithrix sp.]
MADLNGASAGGRKMTAARRTTPADPPTPAVKKRALVLAVGPAADPMSKVLATGPRIPVAVTIAVAIFLHVGIAGGATAASLFDEIFAWQKLVRDTVDYRLSQYEMDIIKEPEPPPPEAPKPEPEPEPEPEKPVPAKAPPPDAPPQPAEAAKVLTADPQPSEGPVDLTNTFVTGSGSTYAGGTTSSDGTSKTAVYNPAAAPTGVPGGTGTGPAPAPPRKDDKSRAPGLLGSVDWNDCPFPGEADAEQIDQAFVLIQVKVKPDGSPENVSVVQDPGHGFGREARKCAMRKKYSQGLDPDGNAIGGTTKPFRVRFER